MTDKVTLIGTPLKRRHSELMHNAAFAHYGVDARYELREIPAEALESFFAEVRDGDWLGFQVTAPHKEVVIEYLDEVEEGATAIGAVNSGIKEPDGTLRGFNTDATGFLKALQDELEVDVDGSECLVAGAGGAARAVTWALLDAGAAKVLVTNRTTDRAHELASRFSSLGRVDVDTSLGTDIGEPDIAVNATTVGMTSDGVPFDVALLPTDAAVFDLVYVPAETPLVRAARDRGLRVSNGLGMLVAQAAAAFTRWTGIPDPAPVMRDALQTDGA